MKLIFIQFFCINYILTMCGIISLFFTINIKVCTIAKLFNYLIINDLSFLLLAFLFNLVGIPPFVGFSIKLILYYKVLFNFFNVYFFFILLSNLLLLLYYISVIYYASSSGDSDKYFFTNRYNSYNQTTAIFFIITVFNLHIKIFFIIL